MFRAIWSIYKSDMRSLAKNWVALVIAIGLILLPSLYAWVNIYASWDPYGNTKGIKVGIVNLDRGGKLKDISVDIGESVVSSLKENDKLGWIFFEDRDEGIRQAEKGNVYATIIIPEDFSEKMCTMLDSAPQKPQLEYYVNEKINAIAPKMTDSGATTIQKQITTSFIETAVEKVFQVFNLAGVELEAQLPAIEKYRNMLYFVMDHYTAAEEGLDKLIAMGNDGVVLLEGAPDAVSDVQSVLEQFVTFCDDVSDDLLQINDDIRETAPKVKENLLLVSDMFADVSSATASLGAKTLENKPSTIEKIDESISDIERLGNKLNDLNDTAVRVGTTGVNDVTAVIADMTELMANAQSDLQRLRSQLQNLKQVESICSSLRQTNQALIRDIGKLEDTVNTMFGNIDSDLAAAEDVLKKVEAVLGGGTAEAQNELAEAAGQARGRLGSAQIFDRTRSILDDIVANRGNDLGQLGRLQLSLSENIENIRGQLRTERYHITDQLDTVSHTLRSVNTILYELSDFTSNLRGMSRSDITLLIERLESISLKLEENKAKLQQQQSSGAEKLNSQNAQIQETIEELKKKLAEMREHMGETTVVEDSMRDISSLTLRAQEAIDRVTVQIDNDILPRIEKYLLNGSAFSQDLSRMLEDIKADSEQVKNLLEKLAGSGQVTVDELQGLRNKMPAIQGKLEKIKWLFDKLNQEISVEDIIGVMKNDAAAEGDFFSSPVDLKTTKLYPMKNYGAAMTPFYSVLSLWVGALLLSALLTTKAKNMKEGYTPKQEFFGKYFVFATMALLQGAIVTIGDMLVLGVEIMHPVLFVCLGMFDSLVFCMMVYSLVALCGNVGKAIGVVFLVLQLAGAGGTFPIQVTPMFFQLIHAALPFTYAISAMREAIAGIEYDVLLKDIALLLGYFTLFMLLGALLKKQVNKLLAGFSKKLGKSGITEH